MIRCGSSAGEYDNRSMEELTLPPSLRRVGRYALLDCRSLKTLRCSDHIQFWGSGAFMNCRELSHLELESMQVSYGETFSFFAASLPRELDVLLCRPEGRLRLILPEYTEAYEENSPAHHFDLKITGGGYPYHSAFRDRQFVPAAYDALWSHFLAGEYEEDSALRLAWYRLRFPCLLGPQAEASYRSYIRAHMREALRFVLEENDADGLSVLLAMRPSEPDAADALGFARSRGRTAAVAQLLAYQGNSNAGNAIRRGRSVNFDL